MSRLDPLPEREKRLLDTVRAIARRQSLAPYLVGGPVRDLELGREVRDLDLTMENGAQSLAIEIARRLQGEVREFPQFLTFKISFDDGSALDVATTRRETYPTPGALPVVTAATLEDDLERRDFTVNAMAVHLLDERPVDPFRGLADLGAGMIRILHEKSFIDDPTRILRALRLAARLGFTLEERTRTLLDEAVASDALGTVSRDRKLRELFLSFQEPSVADVLVAFADSRVLRHLVGVEALDVEKVRRVEGIIATRDDLDRDVLFLGALRPPDPASMGLSDRRVAKIRELTGRGGSFARELIAAGSDEERFALCSAVSPELLAMTAAADDEVHEIASAWEHSRGIDLGVRGDELGVPPGPHIAKALAKTRAALSRNAISPADARAFARQAALEYLGSSKTEHE